MYIFFSLASILNYETWKLRYLHSGLYGMKHERLSLANTQLIFNSRTWSLYTSFCSNKKHINKNSTSLTTTKFIDTLGKDMVIRTCKNSSFGSHPHLEKQSQWSDVTYNNKCFLIVPWENMESSRQKQIIQITFQQMWNARFGPLLNHVKPALYSGFEKNRLSLLQ